jgi:hypothetical protein
LREGRSWIAVIFHSFAAEVLGNMPTTPSIHDLRASDFPSSILGCDFWAWVA